MISLTQIAYGSRVRRQGRSRLLRTYQARMSRRSGRPDDRRGVGISSRECRDLYGLTLTCTSTQSATARPLFVRAGRKWEDLSAFSAAARVGAFSTAGADSIQVTLPSLPTVTTNRSSCESTTPQSLHRAVIA